MSIIETTARALADTPVTAPAVAAKDVTRRYGSGDAPLHALRGVTLTVPTRQFRAVLSDPDAPFADEPTGNLDSHASAEILRLMRESVDIYGQTTVMVTHDPHAASIADRVIVLADGECVADVSEPTEADVVAALQ